MPVFSFSLMSEMSDPGDNWQPGTHKKLQGVGVAMKFLYKCGYYHSMRVDQYDVQSNGRLRIYR